jgi:hypothetical protein
MKHQTELQISTRFDTAPWLALSKQIARHILCRRHSAGQVFRLGDIQNAVDIAAV